MLNKRERDVYYKIFPRGTFTSSQNLAVLREAVSDLVYKGSILAFINTVCY